MLNQALKSYFISQTKWFQGKSITNITKHLRISAKVLYYYIMPMRDLFHNLFFNPAVIVLHEVDALNRCS